MPLLLRFLALVILANIGLQYKYRLAETHQVQYETLQEVQRIFPAPVHYIDRSSMMPSYPKSGFFMSSWGVQRYIDKAEPVISQAMEVNVIPVLIKNSPEINRVVMKGERASLLLPEDQTALRENYIPHWGHIWIAGKSLSVSPTITLFDNLVPGTYTLQSQSPVIINGVVYSSGQFVNIPRGPGSVTSETRQPITLRWGENIKAPESPAPTRPIFSNF